jgi:hypothetical protein
MLPLATSEHVNLYLLSLSVISFAFKNKENQYMIIILPIILPGYETWSLTLKEVQKITSVRKHTHEDKWM